MAGDDGGGIHIGSNQSTITNCILYYNSPDEIYRYNWEEAAIVTYSNILGGYSGEGNIDSDPLFVGGGDYHLKSLSPCKDAGTAVGAPDNDIDGDSRPQGSGYDIGADEFVVKAMPWLLLLLLGT